MSEKIDFKKTVDAYRAQRGKFRIVEVPAMQFLMVDGTGDPNSDPNFAAALEALYPVAYKLKFLSKQQLQRDYVVPPLEGLWWAPDMTAFTGVQDRAKWHWTVMIMVPEWIERQHLDEALAQARKASRSSKLDEIRLETYAEGLSVQTLHVGSFSDEGPVLEKLHDEFIPEHGLCMTGKHHEIYFSDFRRAKPETWRTLLRQPVMKRESKWPGQASI